ncbi:hypothetical protein CROQUDRAFT_129879 [Cronartium quercuum f. sp. fusiforme G11]|uniref:Uncharacterized protein n=1 Tax=Cronartium quercuum f. sp. fusiforme G11 TaxID=708437 RepID=A0A9P6NWS4_9BASI|nr:hypothetical protein CROQUDRAFT_129879 [Cronartium quercuum f. sp. fusiforme G11]
MSEKANEAVSPGAVTSVPRRVDASQNSVQLNPDEEEIEGDEYPTQHHAGKVGLGPQYHAGGGLADKVEGFKDQVIGKLKKDPEKIQHGKEQASGELAKKEREKDMQEVSLSLPRA